MTQADDMLETVLERAGGSAALRAVGWQQLVDLLARRPAAEGDLVDRAFQALADWRSDTSADRRRRACAGVADLTIPPRLFELLVQDDDDIAAPVLTRARTDDAAILSVLPNLSGPSRALLRHREPLTPAVRHALDALGPGDRALPNEAAGPDPVVEPARTEAPRPVPIRDLVDRIDRFRQARPARSVQPPAPAPEPERVRQFAFETGCDGVIRWVDATCRGAIVGVSLAETADGIGVDAPTAARFAGRLSITDGTLVLADHTPVGGRWTLAARPVFAPLDGRFEGYVGQARRAIGGTATPGWALARSDLFQQLMHELKTPLNAVIGFAELMEEQLLGELPAEARAEASRIRSVGREVLDALDDIDMAARLDAELAVVDGDGHECDLSEMISSVAGKSRQKWGGSVFDVHPAGERPVAVAPPAVHRMVDRLLNAVAAATSPGERITVMITGRKWARLRIGLPALLSLLPADDLARLSVPALHGDGEPLLGLQFALRLVRRLAVEAGGELNAGPEGFTLSLPVPDQKERVRRR